MTRARYFSRLLSRLRRRTTDAPRPKQNQSRRLFLESLEDRRVMATIGSTFDAGTGTLTLTGNDAVADELNISLAGGALTLGTTAGNTIDLTSIGLLDAVGPQAVPLGAATVNKLFVNLKGHGDTINLSGVAATPLLTQLDINDTGLGGPGDAVNASGSVDFGGSLAILGVESTTLSTNITTVGAQTYFGDVTLGSNVVLSAGAGAGLVTFHGKIIGGGNDLTVTGNAIFGDQAVDTVTGVDALSVSGTTTFHTSTVTTTGTQTYGNDLTLGTDLALTASTATFNGKIIGGGNDLAIAGNAVFGNDAADTVTALGLLSVTGTTTINTNTVTSTGTQTYGNDVTLVADLALTASTATFNGKIIGGTNDLTVTGNAAFGNEATDTVTGVDVLSVTGATTIETTTVTTTGAQTYGGDVTLAENVVLSANAGAALITFNGQIIGGGSDLTISGNAAFGNDAADTVTGVDVLSVSGTTAINTNTISTTGAQTYTGAATIGAAAGTATLSTTDDVVLFSDTTTLDSNLTLNAGAGNITFTGAVNGGLALEANSTGTTRFSSAVGAGTSLASVTTNAGGTTEINGGAIRTTGEQKYNDDVTLGADTLLTANTVTFNDTIVGNGNDLIVDGKAVFGDGAADSVTGVDVLSVSAFATVNTNTISTTGAQTYSSHLQIGSAALLATLATTNDAVAIGGNTTLGSDLTVNAGSGSITFTGSTSGGFALALNSTGTTRFQSQVGFGVRHTSVTTDAGGVTEINGIRVLTGPGPQTYNDAVSLGDGTILIAGTATFNGTVVGNGHGLQILGDVVFGNAAADTVTGVDVLSVFGTTIIETTTITTTGAQTYGGDVTLAENVVMSAGAGAALVTFNGKIIGGGNDLTITGSAVFGDAAADTVTGVDVLSVSGTTRIETNTITTTGGQTYSGDVTLGENVTLTATAGAGLVTFNGKIIGAGNDLTITGNTIFGNEATDTVTGVDVLSVTGTTTIETTTITTSGSQTYGGNVTLGENVVLTASAGTGDVTFNGQIIGGGNDLTITGNAVFGNAAADTVTGVDVLSVTGTTTIRTDSVSATAQTFTSAVILDTPGNTTTLSGTDITFNSTVRSATDGEENLIVSATGTVNFKAAVGDNSQRLASLIVTAGAALTLEGSVTVTGDINLAATDSAAANNSITVVGPITITAEDPTRVNVVTFQAGDNITLPAGSTANADHIVFKSIDTAIDAAGSQFSLQGSLVGNVATGATIEIIGGPQNDLFDVASGRVQGLIVVTGGDSQGSVTIRDGKDSFSNLVKNLKPLYFLPELKTFASGDELRLNDQAPAQSTELDYTFEGPTLRRGSQTIVVYPEYVGAGSENDVELVKLVTAAGNNDVTARMGVVVSEWQRVLPQAGSFTLTFNGQTTASISTADDEATVRGKLEALSNINPGDVAVTKVGAAFDVRFTGALANQNLTLTSAAASIITIVHGSPQLAKLPNILQVDSQTGGSPNPEDRFQIEGTAGVDNISIGDITRAAQKQFSSEGAFRAHFELNGFKRLWVRAGDGNDVIDNISSAPCILDGGRNDDSINAIVDDANSRFTLNAKKIAQSITNNVTIVLGNQGGDSLYAGSGAMGRSGTPAQLPLIQAINAFPDRGIVFLLGDYELNPGNQIKRINPLGAADRGDKYASSSSAPKHGLIAFQDFNQGGNNPDRALGKFKFAGGDLVRFSTTIAWLQAQIFVKAAVDDLVKALQKQSDKYTKVAGSPEGGSFEEGPDSTVPALSARLDVNRDGRLTAQDALTLINEINASGIRPVPAVELPEGEETQGEGSELTPTLDVNDDGLLTAADVLQVINVLNWVGSTGVSNAPATDEVFEELSGQQPQTTPPAGTKISAADAIFALLASDAAAAERRRQEAAAAL